MLLSSLFVCFFFDGQLVASLSFFALLARFPFVNVKGRQL